MVMTSEELEVKLRTLEDKQSVLEELLNGQLQLGADHTQNPLAQATDLDDLGSVKTHLDFEEAPLTPGDPPEDVVRLYALDGTWLVMKDSNGSAVPLIGIFDRDLSQQNVVDTGAEVSIYSHVIPANTLGATGGVRLTLTGDRLNDTGSARFTSVKVKLGATSVFAHSHSPSVNAARRYWTMVIWFFNSSASAQKWGLKYNLTAPGAQKAQDASATLVAQGVASSSEDTTGDLTLDVTVQWEAGNPSRSFRKEMAFLEFFPAI